MKGARRTTISAVINTLNEEHHLGFALRSVRDWVDEIVVVEMDSDDRTAEIARSFGARVSRHDWVGYADPARTFAGSSLTESSYRFVAHAKARERREGLTSEQIARRYESEANRWLGDEAQGPRRTP
ncbi:MAG: glycosyltransferase [Chloroflexota bacterium]